MNKRKHKLSTRIWGATCHRGLICHWMVMMCLVLLGASLVIGCETAPTPGPPPTASKKRGAAKKTAPPPAVQEARTQEEYQRPEYPGAKRNPFMPEPELIQPVQASVVGAERPREPLEEYALNSLALNAIISETAIPSAMFLSSDGFGHIAQEGDRIGRNQGVITSIRDNEVEVTEGAGGAGERIIVIPLREAEFGIGQSEELSESEREALERLLKTEQGRAALEQNYRNPNTSTRSEEQPAQQDSRFTGIAPPGRSSEGQ